MKTVRIGCGAGFSGDRIDPAIELAARGELDYLVFECLAERTIALAQQAKARDPDVGYDPMSRAGSLAFADYRPVRRDQVGPARCGTSRAVKTPIVSIRSTSRSRSCSSA